MFSEAGPLVVSLAAGVLLASAAGLRAFLPLCVVAWLGWLRIIPLNESFAFLGTLPAVITFTVAVMVEILGDKFPVVDHILDAIGFFIKPVVGTIVLAASLRGLDPLHSVVLGILAGGTAATAVHFLKAKGRIAANAASLGYAAPVVSFVEDVVSVTLTICAVLIPVLAILLFAGLAYVAVRIVRRRAAVARRAQPHVPT